MSDEPVFYMKVTWNSSSNQTRCYRRPAGGGGWTLITTKGAGVTSWSTGYSNGSYGLGISHYNPTTGAASAILDLGSNGGA